MEHPEFSFLHICNFYLPVLTYISNLVRFGVCLGGQKMHNKNNDDNNNNNNYGHFSFLGCYSRI